MAKKVKQTLILVRKCKKADYTIGVLSFDGVRLCNILELPVNGTHHGKTAIPAGTYEIDLDIVSPKYKDRAWAKPYGGKVPTLKNVPGRDRILIHPGNTVNDTDGCLLPGHNTVVAMVTSSVKCYDSLMSLMLSAKEKGIKTYIKIA